MRKIPTIFERDWDGDRSRVLDQPTPGCEWVFAGEGVATRKLDGTCCLLRDGVLYKRHEVKAKLVRAARAKRGGKAGADYVLAEIPEGFEEVERQKHQYSDLEERVGWVPVGDGPEDRWHREAFEALMTPCGLLVSADDGETWGEPQRLEGTYELLGPKIQGNPERAPSHMLIAHEAAEVLDAPRDFAGLAAFLAGRDIEGIVWHHPDERMAKIKARDLGVKRGSSTTATRRDAVAMPEPTAAKGCEVCGRTPAPGGFCSEECVRVDAARTSAASGCSCPGGDSCGGFGPCGTMEKEQPGSGATELARERVEGARSRISRVNARLHLLDRTSATPEFPTELRLLAEALDLLDPEVKLA